MTVSTQILESAEFVGDGVISELPFNFYFDDDSDVTLYEKDSEGTWSVSARTFSVNRDNTNSESGSLTLSAPLGSGKVVKVVRDTSKDQLEEIHTHSKFLPEMIEKGYDKLTCMIQELCARSIKLPKGSNINTNFPVPFKSGHQLTNDGNRLLWGAPAGDLDDLTNVQIKTAFYSNDNVAGSVDFVSAQSLRDFNTPPNWMKSVRVLSKDGGVFLWDAASTETENGGILSGTVISPVSKPSSGRWLRVKTKIVKISWFTSSFFTDSHTALENAIQTIKEGGVLCIDEDFTLNSTALVPDDMTLRNVYIKGEGGLITLNTDIGLQIHTPTNLTDDYISRNITIDESVRFYCDPASVILGQFVKIFKTYKPKVYCNIENPGNGGVYIGGGCKRAVVGAHISGKNSYSVIRGVWVTGSDHSDFEEQLMDVATIDRNATPLPTHLTPYNTKVLSDVLLPAGNTYAVYLMSAVNTVIQGCHLEGDSRCIAVNNYSRGTKVLNNTLKDSSNTSGTGVLITQYSDCKVDGNDFIGSFGGNRAVYVQYGAKAKITNNDFSQSGSNNIQINMGGYADISDNYNANTDIAAGRHVLYEGIDTNAVGAGTNVTRKLPSFSFTDNKLGKVTQHVIQMSNLSYGGNEFEIEDPIINGNKINSENITVFIAATSGSGKIRSGNNEYLGTPPAVGLVSQSGSADYEIYDGVVSALFRVNVVAGAKSVIKLNGGELTLAAASSGNSIVLVPRERISGVAKIVSIEPWSGNVQSIRSADRSATNPVVDAYDDSDVLIASSVATYSFLVRLEGEGNGL